MDLTIEVMLPPRGATDFSQSAHPKWRVLSIVAVYPRKQVDVVGMPRTGYVHVTDIPERAGWAAITTDELMTRINRRLCAMWEDGATDRAPTVVEKRLWVGLGSLVPVNARNRLLTDRQITVTWTQFKNFIQNVRDQRALADSDLDD